MSRIPPAAIPRRVLPAWLLSAGVHVLAVLLLSLLAVTSTRPLAREAERRVGIVLARPQAAGRTEYFTEPIGDGRAESAASVDSRADSAPADSALPAAELASSLVLSDMALPAAPDGANVPGEGLVPAPRLTAGGRRSVPSGLDESAILAEEAARRQAMSAKGPMAEIGLFAGSTAVGRSFVFLIDRSKSMGHQGLGALIAAERELISALDRLGPSHRFQVIAYHHQCVYLDSRKLLPATEENKKLVKGFVSGLAALGATEHELALMSALHLEPDVIFLLTDGGEPHLGAAQLRRIGSLAAGRTAIHCVQFGFGPLQERDNFMRRLAQQNSGGYGYVDMQTR